MPRLWICGIMQNNADDLNEIFKPLEQYMSSGQVGGIWVDGGSTDETPFIAASFYLDIKNRKWTNDHDFSMNEYLRDPRIKHGDWVMQCDTSERVNPDFVEKLLNGMLDNFEKQGVNTVYQRSKPMLFRKFDDQFFLGSPHWGLQQQRRHMVDISTFDGFEDDKTYFSSNRDDINKWVTNGMKYYHVYGRSNHMWLVYSPANYPNSSQSLIQQHEQKRMEYRDYCRSTLRLCMDNLDDITEYMKLGEVKLFPDKFKEFVAYEKVLTNYFRYINGEDQQTIYDTQNTYKFSI